MNQLTTNIGISVNDVSVSYPIFNTNAQNLRKRLINYISGNKFKDEINDIHYIHALRSINLSLEPGRCVGLVGRNGAGKSTLLKLMAGILEPTSGAITRNGEIASILTIGSGMELELDGYQNISRMCMLKGYSLSDSRSMSEEIVDFAQLGRFINLPVRTYSSGMKMRLAFAIATARVPDILLIDEVFGAGDAAFAHKAKDRIQNIASSAKCVVISSHSENLIKEFCNYCIYLNEGKLVAYDKTDEVLKYYNKTT